MNTSIDHRINAGTQKEIVAHLRLCDSSFSPPLSDRVDIEKYAAKIVNHAIRFEAWSDDRLIGLLAAYCNDEENSSAFVTSVSVIEEWRGRRVACDLLSRFIQHAKAAKVSKISLSVGRTSDNAIQLYNKFGFEKGQETDHFQEMNLTLQNENR